MADRKAIEHSMIFELPTIKDFFSYFGNGYCVEMPLDKTKLNKLLNYLSAQENEKRIKAETIMQNICKILGIGSYCVYAGGTQTIIDAEGDVIAFVDFSEM